MQTPLNTDDEADADTADSAAKDRQYVTALARGLRILSCFDAAHPTLSLPEIVRLTGLPQPTAWRLCHTLLKEGFIVCAGEPHRMALGLPALALGHAALAQDALPTIALPYMRALTERHRMGTSLALRDGTEMVYVQRVHGDFAYLNDPVGARRSIALAPTGWACYAGSDVATRQALGEVLQQRAPETWPQTQAALEHAVEQCARQGFITSIGVLHEQLNVVAVPLRSQRSGRAYALSASGLAAQWPLEKLAAIGEELAELSTRLVLVAD